MPKSSLEQRVALIQNIREISANNEKTMNSIHNVVSNSTPVNNNLGIYKNKFKLRIFVATLLLILYVFLDFEKVELMGYNTDDVEKMVEYNFNYQEILKQANTQLTNVIDIE
jgi:hypothetical protein